jgi:hypothetical protein
LSKRSKRAKGKTTSMGDVHTGSSTETLSDTVDFQEISGYVADSMVHAKLAFDLHINFDDGALASIGDDIKLVAKAVVDMIEDGDGYSWV